MKKDDLSARERQVLEAVILSYVENAEAAGSRTIAKNFKLGISAATVRNTMSDLEDRGYLYHPHTSAGRIPTDLAYRIYVDGIIGNAKPSLDEQDLISRELRRHTAIDTILERATDVLGVVTQELGVAAIPSYEGVVLEKLELVQVSSEKLLMVLVLKGAAVRTVFVEAPNHLPREAIESVARVLNERLGGLTLGEIRQSVRERLRETSSHGDARELINIFVQEADNIFVTEGTEVLISSAQNLAEQPEFSSSEKLKELLELTEHKDFLSEALKHRPEAGLTVTIGGEHIDPKLAAFTIVTSSYRRGALEGVLGVIGPTRMPYHKVVALVEYTSKLVDDLVEEV